MVAGRHRHLTAQRRALRELPVDLHVVVSLGDAGVEALLEATAHDADAHTVLVTVPADPQALPLAAGRNVGAQAALDAGAELLIFLDVDCIPGPELVQRYVDAASEHPSALLCGPVTYLPPRDTPWPAAELIAARKPHAARPDPPPGETVDADPRLFWSLSFATTSHHWLDVGGFDEGYVGYGAEDTDFGRRGIPMRWVGGADAYHQHHPSGTPPVQHVDAILRNGARYARRWGEWPMPGWLDAFADRGLVHRAGREWVRAPQIRLATAPAAHAYVDAVRPACAAEAAGGRGVPDPLMSADYLRRVATDIDVLHVHFGYEHLTPAELECWAATVRSLRLPLVVTVHDLRNPHLEHNERHDQHLHLLVNLADELITLTSGAADEIEARYGRRARVLAHPTVLERVPPRGDKRTVTVPLGLLRRNVVEPAALVAAVVAGAERAEARVRVSVRREAGADSQLHGLHDAADAGQFDLLVHERFTDAQLAEFVADTHVLVLPYRFGTHSGWLEVARDVGTAVVAPSCGYYARQWPAALTYVNDEECGLRAATLSVAVEQAASRPRPAAAERSTRLAEQAETRAEHEVLYRRAMSRS